MLLAGQISDRRRDKMKLLKYAIVSVAGILVSTGTVFAGGLREVQIPKQSDWTEHKAVIKASEFGSWDTRFYGQISPSTAVKKNGVFYLYYVGANGNRPTDGGPKDRALGVATSRDGIHFTKYRRNPVITHQPAGNVEEGIGSAAGMIDKNGHLLLYYGAIWAQNASTEEVHCHVALAQSRDGKSFKDYGYVLSWNDRSVWGYGDEIGPLGAYYANGKYNVYYVAKGSVGVWKLGVATGPSKDKLTNTRAALTKGQIIGGCDPVFITDHKIALFIICDFDRNYIEVRTADVNSPGELSDPVETYRVFPPRYRHTVVYLDRHERKWFMYQATDRAKDGNHIVVRTAPMKLVNEMANSGATKQP